MQGKINVRIEQRLVAELVDIAAQERKTLSDITREALLAYLARKAK
jgi:predicted HicB family RNase H-like nuclease